MDAAAAVVTTRGAAVAMAVTAAVAVARCDETFVAARRLRGAEPTGRAEAVRAPKTV